MKRLPKSIYLLIIIVVLGFWVGMYNYRKPIPIIITFNEALILIPRNDEILKKTKIKINANLRRGFYRGSILNFNAHFINKLDGTIIIDGKEYKFDGVTAGPNHKSILGVVYGDNQSNSSIFMYKMNDLNSILLLGTDKEWDGRSVVAPANTIEDYRYISEQLTK